MGSQKAREPRHNVRLLARMRVTDEWSDITLCNLSSRGLMAKCVNPPPRGSYVDIRRGHVCIVARVVWSQGPRFGARSQDTIDFAALQDPSAKPTGPGMDRRTAARPPVPRHRRPCPAAESARARRIAHLLDWGLVAFAVVAVCGVLVHVAFTALSAPMEQVRSGLESRGH